MTKFLRTRHVSLDPSRAKEIQTELQDVIEERLEPGEMLKKLRVQKGLSPQDLGEQMGLTGVDIIKMEEGEVQMTQDIGRKLGTIFHIDFEAFFF